MTRNTASASKDNVTVKCFSARDETGLCRGPLSPQLKLRFQEKKLNVRHSYPVTKTPRFNTTSNYLFTVGNIRGRKAPTKNGCIII